MRPGKANAAHLVSCAAQGYNVRGTVRSIGATEKVSHLLKLAEAFPGIATQELAVCPNIHGGVSWKKTGLSWDEITSLT